MATRINFKGLPLRIEYRKGETKTSSGDSPAPHELGWPMYADYGYIENTVSPELGEEMDVYVGDDETSDLVFFCEILKTDDEDSYGENLGNFDEFKVLLGFPSLKAARSLMQAQYGSYKSGMIIQSSINDLKEMASLSKERNRKEKLLINLKEKASSTKVAGLVLNQYGQQERKNPQLVVRS